MNKIEKLYNTLMGHELTASNGEMGYLVPIETLLKNGGRNEFSELLDRKKTVLFLYLVMFTAGLNTTEKTGYIMPIVTLIVPTFPRT